MSNNYEYYLDQFHSQSEETAGSVPIKLPNGEKFQVSINTNNDFGLETIDAVGLYQQFEFNWKHYYGDFVMSGLHGETRYVWAVLKQDGDCGIVTFYLDKKYNKLAEVLLQDLAKMIDAKHFSTTPRTTGEA